MTEGLTPDAAAAYRHLVANPGIRREELVNELGIDAEGVNSILAWLKAAHLVHFAVDDDRLVAISPAAATQRALTALEAEVAARRLQVASLENDLGRLQPDYQQALDSHRAHHTVQFIPGLDNVRTRLEDLAAVATRCAWSLNPGSRISESALAASRPLDKAVLQRGVSLRSVFQHTARTHPPTLRYVQELSAKGADMRTVARMPTRLAIIDDHLVLPAEQEGVMGALLFADPRVAVLGVILFEHIWQMAIPFGSELTTDDEEPNDQQVAVLQGLVLGKKDETIARELGISVRTMRRQVALLMTQLQADTRFQAGATAVQRGWI